MGGREVTDDIIRAALAEAGGDERDGRRREDMLVIAVIKIVQRMFDEKFNDHVTHEMERYESIDRRIVETNGLMAANLEASNEQHGETRRLITSLQQSINAYMTGQEEFARAFLKKPDGSLDLEGHYDDHDTRSTSARWWADKRDKIITKVLEYAGVAVVLWIAQALITQAVQSLPK